MRLHQTGVGDAKVGGGHPHTTVALLEGDGEDKPGVDAGGAGDALDGRLEVVALLRRVVGLAELRTRDRDDRVKVGIPHGVKVKPRALRRPALGDIPVPKEVLDVGRRTRGRR